MTDSNEHDITGYVETFSTYGKSNDSYSFAKSLVDSINNANYDLIINSGSSFIPVVCLFFKTPIISVSHFVNGMIADRASYKSEYISRIISLSNYGKDYLEKRFSIEDKDKVEVIYNFVHPKAYMTNKMAKQPLTIVYPGGTSIKKGVDVVIEMLYRLKRSKLPFKFIWIGQTLLPSAKYSILGLRETTKMLQDERIEIKGLVSREKAEDIIGSANIFFTSISW